MQKLGLSQSLQQKLSPQQIQFIKLLQVPTAELEARIEEELEQNPALEEGEEESVDEQPEMEEEIREDSKSDDELDIKDYLHDDDYSGYKMQGDGDEEEEEHVERDGGPGELLADDFRGDRRQEGGDEATAQAGDGVDQEAARPFALSERIQPRKPENPEGQQRPDEALGQDGEEQLVEGEGRPDVPDVVVGQDGGVDDEVGLARPLLHQRCGLLTGAELHLQIHKVEG